MEFRLVYKGILSSNGFKEEKQKIRKEIHAQLKKLWNQEPLINADKELIGDKEPDDDSRRIWGVGNHIKNIGTFKFVPLISRATKWIAELDILFLSQEEAGQMIKNNGDIDNRLKTLFDALRTPQSENEVPKGDSPTDDEKPFFCLLEDDKLITKVSVTVDQLLNPPFMSPNNKELLVIIKVNTKKTMITAFNQLLP
jgi:hypothetical protein